MSTQLVRIGCVAAMLAVVGVALTGCDRKKSSTEGANGRPEPVNEPAPPETQPASVDAQDAPDAPRAIPKSHDLRGWAKSEPVCLFTVNELDKAVPDAGQRTALTTFPLKRIARCAFRREGVPTTAAVLFIEAPTPEDAFGLFSVMTSESGTLHSDGTIRALEKGREAVIVSGWQGTVFAQVRCTNDNGDPPSPDAADVLLANILFYVPSAEPPWLFRALQSGKGELVKLWVVRSAAALVVTRHSVLSKIDPAAMNTRLGLHGPELLAVAAVNGEPGDPPNIVWLVQYRQPADAKAAWDRYQKVLEPGAAGIDANTLVHEPKGAYLAGSWTADLESTPAQHQLDKLGAILPG